MTQQVYNSVFISYRHSVSSFLARAIYQDLRTHGYDVFMDVESIDSGAFESLILRQIEARAHFLVIFTPGTVEQFIEPGDWMRREVVYAIESRRNIVPILVNDFRFDEKTRKLLPGKLLELERYNAINIPHDYFEEAMERLRRRYLKQPVDVKIADTTVNELTIVQGKVAEVEKQPTPNAWELTAEFYLNRALERDSGDYEGQIADLSEALRLNRNYTQAQINLANSFLNRGRARKLLKDFEFALKDFELALEINPHIAEVYVNRGDIYLEREDNKRALEDYIEAIRLSPSAETAYLGRGIVYARLHDYEVAINDFNRAIELNPTQAAAYLWRAKAYQAQGTLDKAVKDYQQLVRLSSRQERAQYQKIATETQITYLLANTHSVEAVSRFDEECELLRGEEWFIDDVIDEMLKKLILIGHDIDAALNSLPGSYVRQMALRDAHGRIIQLANTLQTHHSQRVTDWLTPLQQLSILLDNYLKEQESIQATGFPNPYMAGIPIQPSRSALFKGRVDLADQIINKLRTGTRPTLILHGPRRMGKTSFLLQLQNLLPGSYLPVFCDVLGTGADQSNSAFFYKLARSIYQQVNRMPKGDSISRPEYQSFTPEPIITFTEWLDDEVLPTLQNKTLLVTFDEFEKIGEAISVGRLTADVLSTLRHIMQHTENVVLMFAGVQTLSGLGSHAASYFIGAQNIEISYLESRAAEELIRNPDPSLGSMPEYDSDAVQEILALTHCQPFLLQAICSEIINIANRDKLATISRAVLSEGVQKVLSSYQMFFQNIWDDAGTQGRVLLTRLAYNPKQVTQTELEVSEIQGLLVRRVIFKHENGNFEIEIPFVREWIRQQN